MENPTQNQIKEILEQSKRIAIVGLSNRPDRTSYQIGEALLRAGYEIIPVNPTIDEVFGIKAVSCVTEIQGSIDIVNVFRRSEHLVDVANKTVETDAKVFWAQLGLSSEEAYTIIKDAGKTAIMDRCIKVDHAILVK
ncbi:CoA-binding protein [Salipaludibacillus keqinensis]|uniref:CoA-binding protein n=1 Tax=Salipaludibacillus keqinensis TaxID=2045207 RepID=A0A323TK83_9BACI|nr:CoA-binding protein [Salipaludibacillus keqinensis]PYZ95209.1 CoA-binding protein [Salipaludibacillus keqinensis]